MKIEFTRENSGNYLMIKDEETDSFEMRMIRNNNIKGMLAVNTRQVNNQYIYMYNISGKNNMSEIYGKRKMSSSELKSFITGLKNVMEGTKNYLLNESGIILEPAYIFMDTNSDEFNFVYYNDDNTGLWDKLKNLFEYIIGIIDHSDNEAVTLGYGIYKRLCMAQTSIDELFCYEESSKSKECEIITEREVEKDIIPEIRTEETEVPDNMKIYGIYGIFSLLGIFGILSFIFLISSGLRPAFLSSTVCGLIFCVICVSAYALFRWYKNNKSIFYKIVSRELEIPYEKENVRIIMAENKSDNLTTVLNTSANNNKYVEWQENGILKKYIIEEESVIGSSKEMADLIISETGVSRTHAKLIKEDDKYFIKDLNSTNGTYVNDTPLVSYQIMQLHPGDIIRLGNTAMQFH